MSKIRRSAKGSPCLLRVPDVCQGQRDTVVHCHVRLFGSGGMGLKPNDRIGIRACFHCHDWLDNRSGANIHADVRDQLILAGLRRTLRMLHRERLVDMALLPGWTSMELRELVRRLDDPAIWT